MNNLEKTACAATALVYFTSVGIASDSIKNGYYDPNKVRFGDIDKAERYTLDDIMKGYLDCSAMTRLVVEHHLSKRGDCDDAEDQINCIADQFPLEEYEGDEIRVNVTHAIKVCLAEKNGNLRQAGE